LDLPLLQQGEVVVSYFKIKLLTFFAVSSLFVIPVYADQAVLSKEELQQQIKVKEERLNVLNKEIVDLETSIHSMMKRIGELSYTFKEAKKQRLLKEKPKLKITEDDMQNMYKAEIMSFFETFARACFKGDLQITGSHFFEEGLNEVDASILRFYIARIAIDQDQLKKLFIEWETLVKEGVALVGQLESK